MSFPPPLEHHHRKSCVIGSFHHSLIPCPFSSFFVSHHTLHAFTHLVYHIHSTIQGIIPQHSQNRYVAAVIHDSSPSTNVKSAQDIQHLLTNIGADTRASNKMIERLMHKTASSKDSQHVTAGDLIDLIARVRSV